MRGEEEVVGVSSGKDGKRRALVVESRRAAEKKALSTDFYCPSHC